jgi:uncharacterized protein (DUF302 family)
MPPTHAKRRNAEGRRAVNWALAFALCALSPGWAAAQEPALKLYAKQGVYDDVRFELNNAIIDRGLVVDFNGQIAKMLARTGADVGSTKSVYKNAEYFTFCSAQLSRATMEADPLNVGFCPYVVFIYETAAAPGTIQVGYRRPPPQGPPQSKAALEAVEKLLDGIVRDAVK